MDSFPISSLVIVVCSLVIVKNSSIVGSTEPAEMSSDEAQVLYQSQVIQDGVLQSPSSNLVTTNLRQLQQQVDPTSYTYTQQYYYPATHSTTVHGKSKKSRARHIQQAQLQTANSYDNPVKTVYQNPTVLSALPSETYVVPAAEYGNYVAANGWTQPTDTYVNDGKDCNSAVGLLGLLGLISYFMQNVLRQTDPAVLMQNSGAKKRYKRYAQDINNATTTTTATMLRNHEAERITHMILPSLLVIANAREGTIPLHCTHRHVCLANKLLMKELGQAGKPVGVMLSKACGNLLQELNPKDKSITKGINRAAKIGRNANTSSSNPKEDCDVYPLCASNYKPTNSQEEPFESFHSYKPSKSFVANLMTNLPHKMYRKSAKNTNNAPWIPIKFI